MHQLEYDTNRTVIEFALEIKILILEKNMNLAAAADEEFASLSASHLATAARYEAALASVGLSPAREDEMGLVEEMEAAAAAKQQRSMLLAQEADLVGSTLLAAVSDSFTDGDATTTSARSGGKKTVSFMALGTAVACLFAAGILLEKGRNALYSRPL
jgi:hypothetical protein